MSESRIIVGDCSDVLATLPDASVQCCVTSPPYYGLRDYGTGTWEGGAAECDHVRIKIGATGNGIDGGTYQSREVYKDACGKCGASRTDKQLGLEKTPAEYVEKMVVVFREVRRVLRSDGTLWLNIGDSYAAHNSGNNGYRDGRTNRAERNAAGVPDGIKPKDLIGIPWMLAFALRSDGWYLRSDIIWSKPNPMPESVTDRPTKAHEYLFLLSKSERYFYDSDAIAEPSQVSSDWHEPPAKYLSKTSGNGETSLKKGFNRLGEIGGTRNKRSVWTVTTQPFKEAHFATMPPKLVEPCVLAGTSARGCCPECGAPWERQVEREPGFQARRVDEGGLRGRRTGAATDADYRGVGYSRTTDKGFAPTCDCEQEEDAPGVFIERPTEATDRYVYQPIPCTVLDPFSGAGTTGLVANRLGRSFVGIELNPKYAEMARRRIHNDAPLFSTEPAA